MPKGANVNHGAANHNSRPVVPHEVREATYTFWGMI